MNPAADIAIKIKQWAEELGFLACGITSARPISPEDKEKLNQWLDAGYHGEMHYMENHREKRIHPAELVEGAQSVICLAYNYFPNSPNQTVENSPKIAKYAWGEDYHRVVKDKVFHLMQKIADEIPNFQGRGFTDSAPIMERQLAARAGLGWIGKNSLLLRKGVGSFFFLAEIICNLTLPEDNPIITDHCGTCTACIDACPTQAIVQPQVINSNLCISYQTIEKKGLSDLPIEQQQGWIYGCDICQDVCPWNRFSEPTVEKRFESRPYAHADTDKWQQWIENPSTFKQLLKSTAAERTGHAKILAEAQRFLNNSPNIRESNSANPSK
jgi:epoxyqueuosine reductase